MVPISWNKPFTIPSGTDHLRSVRRAFPPLEGDAQVPESFCSGRDWADVAREYREQGFAVVRQLLSPAELAHLRSSVDDYIRDVVPNKDSSHVFTPEPGELSTLQYFSDPHEQQYLASYGGQPKWRYLAACCLGEPFLQEDPTQLSHVVQGPSIQFFNKVPGDKSLHTPAHQDNYYFKLAPPNCLTVWMALDEVDIGNGVLHYVPRSHREGLLPHSPSHVLGFSQSLIGWEGSPQQAREISPGRLSPGDVVIHHCNTIHRADANRSADRHRRSVALVFSGQSAVPTSTSKVVT